MDLVNAVTENDEEARRKCCDHGVFKAMDPEVSVVPARYYPSLSSLPSYSETLKQVLKLVKLRRSTRPQRVPRGVELQGITSRAPFVIPTNCLT